MHVRIRSRRRVYLRRRHDAQIIAMQYCHFICNACLGACPMRHTQHETQRNACIPYIRDAAPYIVIS